MFERCIYVSGFKLEKQNDRKPSTSNVECPQTAEAGNIKSKLAKKLA